MISKILISTHGEDIMLSKDKGMQRFELFYNIIPLLLFTESLIDSFVKLLSFSKILTLLFF